MQYVRVHILTRNMRWYITYRPLRIPAYRTVRGLSGLLYLEAVLLDNGKQTDAHIRLWKHINDIRYF